MVARELSPASCRRLPAGLAGAWTRAYACIWIATLGFALVVALVGEPFVSTTRHVLGLSLSADRNPRPDVEHVLALVVHNIPIFAWPLLLGVTGAHRDPLSRRAADTLLLACVTVNTLQVGAALGAYGTALLPYVSNVPVEWAGLALGASSWLVQRRRALSFHEGIVWLALTAGALLCAATLETMAVAHQ
jgi:hypothetical protein